MGAFVALVRRDVALAWGQRGGGAVALLFFLIVIILFPFAVGPAPQVLARIAPGVLWVAALLASLLTLERLFQPDMEDGTLEQLVTHGLSAELIAAAKILAHWLATAVPLILIVPVGGVLLQLPAGAYLPLMLSLAVGTPGLSAIGGAAAALTLGLRRGGLLTSLLVLPLIVPLLIFGVGVLDPLGGDVALRYLAAAGLLGVAIGPFAAAAGLRLGLE